MTGLHGIYFLIIVYEYVIVRTGMQENKKKIVERRKREREIFFNLRDATHGGGEDENLPLVMRCNKSFGRLYVQE